MSWLLYYGSISIINICFTNLIVINLFVTKNVNVVSNVFILAYTYQVYLNKK